MADSDSDALVAELRALAGWLDVPEPPDVRAAVRLRLEQPSTVHRPHRRLLAAAVAFVVAVLIAVIPPARAAVASAVTGLLRFAGVEVEQTPTVRPDLPATPSPLPSTTTAALADAQRRTHFHIGVPRRLGPPAQVLIADPGPDGAPRVVTLLYQGGKVRLDEFDGVDPAFLKQTGMSGQWVDVADGMGMWLPGPQTVEYIDRFGNRHDETARLAGPTLIWTIGQVTYRLEGITTLDEARAIALSV